MDSKEIQTLIRHHPCFTKLTDDESAALAALFSIKSTKKGSTIVTEHELVDSIYFIVSGTAEVQHRITKDNKTDIIPIATLNPGEAIGLSDTGFYSETGERTATVVATTNMTLLRLDIGAFQTFLQNHPHVSESMQQNAGLLQRMNLIKRAAPFTKLSTEKVRWLADQMQEVTLSQGAIIFNTGDNGDQCYLIQSGKVDIFIPEADGSEKHLATLKSPMIFGEAALFMNLPRNASARAMKDCQLLVLNRESLLHVVETHIDVAESLMTLLRGRSRPMQFPYVSCHMLAAEDEGQEPIITLKNDQAGDYYRLSSEGLFIWTLLDGSHTLRDITLAFNNEYGVFDPGLVSNFIMDLEVEGFIENKPGERSTRSIKDTFALRTAASIKRVMEASVSFGDVDRWITSTYRKGIFIFFTLPGQIVMSLVTIIGFIAFVIMFQRHLQLLNATHNSSWVIPVALVLTMATALFHELAHAYTTKSFGRKVKSFGVGWFWVGPMAFCDTSDMWLSKRKQRVAVDLAGLYWDMFLSGIASIIALFVSSHLLAIFLWLFALIHYLGVFANLSPNIELDGYYTLMDLSGVDNLRESAILWLINDLPLAWRKPSLFLKHKALVAYWLICIAYIILEILVPYIVMNVLLYGVLGVRNPYVTFIVVCLVIFFSSFAIWGEIRRKRKRAVDA